MSFEVPPARFSFAPGISGVPLGAQCATIRRFRIGADKATEGCYRNRLRAAQHGPGGARKSPDVASANVVPDQLGLSFPRKRESRASDVRRPLDPRFRGGDKYERATRWETAPHQRAKLQMNAQ